MAKQSMAQKKEAALEQKGKLYSRLPVWRTQGFPGRTHEAYDFPCHDNQLINSIIRLINGINRLINGIGRLIN